MGLCTCMDNPHTTAVGVGPRAFYNRRLSYCDLNLVIRTYATRHGCGPVCSLESSYDFSNIDETNQTNKFQGLFKKRVLNFDELRRIAYYNYMNDEDMLFLTKSLFITHVDVS